jgi:2-keto-4-pentenoate hydratase/2-oxohepta-3-ene-1,7-dioic acid hydratase in catechol pathway
MKIGRALTGSDRAVFFCTENGTSFNEFNPDSGQIGEQIEILKFLSPTQASKVVCVGLNYRDHAKEFGLEPPKEPLLFLKPASSIIGHLDDIHYPPQSQRVDYEAELGVVISKRCSRTTPENAWEYILGYTCLNDVTARDLQAIDGQWTRAKSFDTFCPVGPWIETDIPNPHDLDISLILNGEKRQSSNTSNLIFRVNELVSYVSNVMTLEKGDVIATGTPGGIGPMQKGDRVCVIIENIGILENTLI